MSVKIVYQVKCDICTTEVESDVKLPKDWIEVDYEPVDRTFCRKQICPACVTRIVYQHDRRTTPERDMLT